MTRFQANGFYSELPKGWVDRSTLTLVGNPSPDGFVSNITVSRQPLPEGTDAESFGATQIALLEKEFPDVQRIQQGKVEVGPRTLIQRTHLFPSNGKMVKQAQVYAVLPPESDPTGVVVTCSASPEHFNDVLPEFKVFLENFQVDA